MVALVGREAKRPSKRGEHLLRRLGPATLLEAGVVVGRHAGELGDLAAAQPGDPPARPGAQSDVFGTQVLTPVAKEVGELFAVHGFHHAPPRRPEGGIGNPTTTRSLVPQRGSAHRGR